MKILIFGAGEIGTIYGWQLSTAGQDVTLLVRLGKIMAYQQGIPIRCKDERTRPAAQIETVFHPKVTETFAPEDGYDLIVVGHSDHSGLWGRLLGDTAARIAAHAHCSVLIVKP